MGMTRKERGEAEYVLPRREAPNGDKDATERTSDKFPLPTTENKSEDVEEWK